MAILRDHVVGYRPDHRHTSTSLEADEFTDEKSFYGLNSDSDSSRCKNESFSDMLLWLKSVAIDPCNLKASSVEVAQSWSQILKARKVLSLIHNEFPWRKRKIGQLLQETPTSDLPMEMTGFSRGQCSFASSIPRLISCTVSDERSEHILQNPHSSVRSLKFSDNLSRKRIPKGPSFQAEALDCSSSSGKEVHLILDSDDSDSGSNPVSPKKQLPQTCPVKLLKSWDVSLLLDSDNSVSRSNLSSPNKPRQHQTSQRSVKSLNCIGDYLPRMAIPVGPRFQADVPDWSGPHTIENSSNGDCILDDSKWLGTKIWPIKGKNTGTNNRVIGKGRPYSCSCNTSGSTNCIKRHIIEDRLRLQSELGPAFYSWRFDEMGEEVSKKWTLQEQDSFKILVRMNPASKNKNFWNLVSKCFPSKCRESIVSYYFNVFVLGRMSRQTRLGCAVVDSDDDETDENVGGSKDQKNRYLNGFR